MTIASAILAAQGRVADAYIAISNKGGTLPATQNLTNMPTAINSIPTGGGSPTINSLTITPTTSQQTITASGGVDGYSPITVNAVTSSIDANIIAGNIKNGVSILGVLGTYSGGGGTFILINSKPTAILTCGNDSYTLSSSETYHVFVVAEGTYTCTARYGTETPASTSVTVGASGASITLYPISIPAAYQEVEYIEGQGGAYINTQVGVTSTLLSTIKFALSSNYTFANGSYLLGTYTQSSPHCRYGFSFPSTTSMRLMNGLDATTVTIPAIAIDSIHTIEYKKGSVIMDGTQVSTAGGQIDGLRTCFVFARNNSSGSYNPINGLRLYSLKMGITGTPDQSADFVPCYRKADNVGGLYDKVSEAFFTSSSGSFIFGPDVT